MEMKRILANAVVVAAAIACPAAGFAEDGSDEQHKDDRAVEKILDAADAHAKKRRWRKAVPLYKEALVARPYAYPSIYFNLAEISRALENCNEAVLLYRRYLEVKPQALDAVSVRNKVDRCNERRPTASVTIRVTGPTDPLVVLAGIPVATTREKTVRLSAGKYTLAVTADDYLGETRQLALRAGDVKTVEVTLTPRTYHGDFVINVNIEGATIKVGSETLGVSPIKSTELLTGKHFVEVSKPGYHRWIRNIVIERGEEYILDVKLQEVKEQ
jgi:tetratricopeptide (TPR) repeat protein